MQYVEIFIEILVAAMRIRNMIVEIPARKSQLIAERALVALRHRRLRVGLAGKVELILGACIVHLQGMVILVLRRLGQLARIVAPAADLIANAHPAGIATSGKGSCMAIGANVAEMAFRRLNGCWNHGLKVNNCN